MVGGRAWVGVRRRARGGARRLRSIYPIDLSYRAARDFSRHQGTVFAAATSYYALTSLFPLVILLGTIFGWVAHGTDLQARVLTEITRQLPPGLNLTKQIQGVLRGSSKTQGSILSIISLLATAWTASGMFGVLRRALNTAFDVAAVHSYFHGRLYDLLSVMGVGLLALLSIGATAVLGLVRAFTSDLFRGTLVNLGWGAVFFLLPFAVSYASFLLLYRLIPNQRLGGGAVRLGALMAAVAFELVKIGFALYVAYFGRYQAVYGTLGNAVAFTVFVFVEATIVIFSAEFASELAKDREQLLPRLSPRTSGIRAARGATRVDTVPPAN